MIRVALAVLLPSLLLAQEEEPARPDPVALINTADKLLQKKAPDEDALLLLWQAEVLLRDGPDSSGRAAVTTALQALLAKADPLQAARSQVATDAAKKIVELAAMYRSKKWFELAADRVAVAARFDPDLAAKEAQLLQAARGANKPATAGGAPPKPAASKQAAPLLTTLKPSQTEGAWQLTDGVLTSPNALAKGKLAHWLTDKSVQDGEIQCDVYLTTVLGTASLLFGSLAGDETFLATCYFGNDAQTMLRIEHCHGSTAEVLQTAMGAREGKGPGWQHLVVRVRGDQVTLELNGTIRLEHKLPRTGHGNLGFLVIGNDAPAGPQFKNLTVGPLPERAPSADEEHGAAQAQRQQGALARIARAEDLLKQKKPEPAVQELRAAHAEVRDLDAGALRDSLIASIDKLLTTNDSVHPRRKKVAAEIGAAFAGLADKYVAAGNLRCALQLANEAASFDPATQAAAVQRVTAALAARDVAEAQARAKELEAPPLENAALVARFATAQPLFRNTQPWTVDATSARVAALTGGDITALVPTAKEPGGRFGMHVHLPAPEASVGFVFDAHGDNDFGVALLHRGPKQLTLAVHRYYLGKWQRLAQRPIPCAQWRHAGWFELQLLDEAAGVTLRLGEHELKVERSKLGAAGRIGLFAEASGSAAIDVELRGWRALP